jgi:anti-anti-sigma factor
MADQEIHPLPVTVTLPAQIDAATAEQAAEQISAAFTPGVTVVIADLTSTACCDCSAIRHLLKAHRKASARGGQVRFVIRAGGSLQRITKFSDIHPLLAVYPTLQHAITGDGEHLDHSEDATDHGKGAVDKLRPREPVASQAW